MEQSCGAARRAAACLCATFVQLQKENLKVVHVEYLRAMTRFLHRKLFPLVGKGNHHSIAHLPVPFSYDLNGPSIRRLPKTRNDTQPR